MVFMDFEVVLFVWLDCCVCLFVRSFFLVIFKKMLKLIVIRLSVFGEDRNFFRVLLLIV